MMRYEVVVSVLAVFLCTSCAVTTPIIPSSSGVTLETLFQIATAKDTQRLLQLEPFIGASSDPVLGVAFPVALYIADPERFAQRFLESFPTTYGELMYGLYELEISGVLPGGAFSTIGALGQYARVGNATATRKLLLAIPHSDGAMAEGLFEEFMKLLQIRPRDVVRAFGLLIGPERTSIIEGLRVLTSGGGGVEIADSLRNLHNLSEQERKSAEILIRALEEAP